MDKFKEYVRLIENTLARQDFDNDPEELYRPISYILSLGGKRLRPALTLAGCDLFNGALDDAMMPALGIEVFHNFSLVHDDIMDQADLRRGKPTVHKKWNTDIAILSGDAMLVKAYQYIAKVDAAVLPRVLKTFSDTALEICEGQQFDMNFENQEKVAEEDYLEMIKLKTAVLLGCALKVGALVGGASQRQAQSLYDFGVYSGMAFQVQDDLLDAFGESLKVGKQEGGDILQDKKTLLMIYARQIDEKGWEELRARKLMGEEKVGTYRGFFKESGAYRKVCEKRDALLKDALDALKDAEGQNTSVKNQLGEFAQWLAHRSN